VCNGNKWAFVKNIVVRPNVRVRFGEISKKRLGNTVAKGFRDGALSSGGFTVGDRVPAAVVRDEVR